VKVASGAVTCWLGRPCIYDDSLWSPCGNFLMNCSLRPTRRTLGGRIRWDNFPDITAHGKISSDTPTSPVQKPPAFISNCSLKLFPEIFLAEAGGTSSRRLHASRILPDGIRILCTRFLRKPALCFRLRLQDSLLVGAISRASTFSRHWSQVLKKGPSCREVAAMFLYICKFRSRSRAISSKKQCFLDAQSSTRPGFTLLAGR